MEIYLFKIYLRGRTAIYVYLVTWQIITCHAVDMDFTCSNLIQIWQIQLMLPAVSYRIYNMWNVRIGKTRIKVEYTELQHVVENDNNDLGN